MSRRKRLSRQSRNRRRRQQPEWQPLHLAKLIASALATIACQRKRMLLWLLLPLATTTLTSETPAPHYYAICALAVSRLLAMLHLRYGRLSSHLTLRAICLYSLFLSSLWCWPTSYAESCQQGGGSTRTHLSYFYMLFIFLSTHSSIF